MEYDSKLNLKNLISIMKNLYKSNLFLENIFEVIIDVGFLGFCYNFFSKIGLTFVVSSIILLINKVPLGLSLGVLFTPTILILANVPISYLNTIIKIKRNKNKKEENIIKEELIINKNEVNNRVNVYYSNNYKTNSNKMIRVRKK